MANATPLHFSPYVSGSSNNDNKNNNLSNNSNNDSNDSNSDSVEKNGEIRGRESVKRNADGEPKI